MKSLDELRSLSLAELSLELKKIEHELFETHIKIEAGQESDTSKQRKLRKQLARIKTVQKEKNSTQSNLQSANQ
jgi:large subunit ribosomal protein L29